ncbi:hypothetical protein QQS21_006314 [Conoideocrella luteorostrata]|uniref:Uncharacterized protein n=1 Tax=Conoideocrella luteorostrata TaxID=1105319 RepID=A0AAJ0FTK9_9HYPO|nr:hypothetical protein QQS21_006314 [Conoideocrella luteorostrata]
MDTAIGSRLLGQIEEVSLEEILSEFRTSFKPPSRLKLTHIPALDALATTHLRNTQSQTISLTGRSLPLVYKIVSTLISRPHSKALLIIDLDGRFDATRLDCDMNDLQHVYIRHPARSDPEHLRALVTESEHFMLYSEETQASRRREWWGTMVLGGLAAGDLTAGWKGWLKVERRAVPGFAMGVSVGEVLGQRGLRQKAVDEAGWVAESEWGAFEFCDGRGP